MTISTIYLSLQTMIAEQRKKISISLLFFLCITVVLLLFFAYVALLNSSVISGYKISKLERKLAQNYDEYKKLELEVTKLQSYPKIKENVSKLNLVKADNIFYIKDVSSLALNE